MRYYIDFWLAESDYQNGEPAVDTLDTGTDAAECLEMLNELQRDSGCYVRARQQETP